MFKSIDLDLIFAAFFTDFAIFFRSLARVKFFFFLRRPPPRSTRVRSSAASDVYKSQGRARVRGGPHGRRTPARRWVEDLAVSYTHLRAHETPEHLVCRLLLEKKKK